MACNYGGDLASALTSGNPYDAIACTYTNAAGTGLTATLVIGAIGVSLYAYSDTVALPTVVLLIIGGALLPFLTSGAVTIVGAVILIVGSLALWLIANTLREP